MEIFLVANTVGDLKSPVGLRVAGKLRGYATFNRLSKHIRKQYTTSIP